MWILKDKDVEKLRIKGKVKALIRLLDDINPTIRASAAEALGDFDRPDVIEALINALKDKDRRVRWNAAKSLEYLCKDKIEFLIESFVYSNSVFQKVSLAWLLGRFKNKKAIPALADALKFGDKYVRRASIIAMGRIRDEMCLPYLIAALEDYDPVLRKRAAEALGRIGILTKEVEKALVNALMDSNSDVRKMAAKSLERLKWRPKTKEELARYLAALKIGSELVLLGDVAIEPLVLALKYGDWNTKSFASDTISKIRSKKAIESLLEVAKSDDWTIRFHALSALGKICEEIEEGIEHLVPFLNDPNPNVREVVRESLKKLCKLETIEKLIDKYPELKRELQSLLPK